MYTARSRAFTIIELLVVITIIGVLVAATSVSFIISRQKARDARRAADIHEIQTALALYYVDCHRFPATLTVTANNGCGAGISLGTFLSVIPADPSTNRAYAYAALGSGANCNSYHLGALMERSDTPVLGSDTDRAPAGVCTGSQADFSGLSAGSGAPLTCDATADTAAPGGAERCYDVSP